MSGLIHAWDYNVKKESQMPEDSTQRDEGQRALDELYKDGRKPTLRGCWK